jgi:outer membrane immunogenic protein
MQPQRYGNLSHPDISCQKRSGFSVRLGMGMGMRRIAIVAAGLLSIAGFTGAASAADFPAQTYTKAAALPPAFNWSGFYAGVTAGGGWFDGGNIANSSNIHSILAPSNIFEIPATSSNSAGATVGGLVGYNYQSGSFVVGVETDFNYIDLKSRRSAVASNPCCGGVLENFNFQSTSQVDWFGTLRGRIGFTPVDRLLVYGTGGLAYGDVETNIQNSETFAGGVIASRLWQGNSSQTKVGWTAGGGLEYAFTNNWTLRGEYLYVDLGTSGTTATFQGTAPPESLIYYGASREITFSVARAALSFKF